jgi:S-formylglutathione hydrolase FrmB
MAVRRPLTAAGIAMIVVALTVVGVGAGVAAGSAAPSKARLVTIDIPAPDGEIASKWLSYPGPPRANVLLPAGYNRHDHYPLVVFLNGLQNDYDSYAQYGLTKPFDRLGAIVVMPEGASGWYTDWWNDGERGSPSWESYELETVIPTILARYPILPQRRYHALIGISMGGLGATYLGGRLPGFFGSVATLSGFVDPQYYATVTQPAMAGYSSAAAHGDTDSDPLYGPPDGFYAGGHNPTLLTENLEHTRVFESTGTGVPSKADPDPAQFDVTEEHIIYPMNESYHEALVSAGIDVTYQVHPGAHDIADFRNEITAMLKWGLFKPVVSEPTSWDNQTVATRGQLWDFNYRFASPPTRIVTFRQSGTTLSISAAGSAVTITTSTGCSMQAPTPATVHLPSRTLISARRPDRIGPKACR